MRKQNIVIAILAVAMTIFFMSFRCDDYNPMGLDKQTNESKELND